MVQEGGLVRDGWCRRGSETGPSFPAGVKVLMIRSPISSSPSPPTLEAEFLLRNGLDIYIMLRVD